jgi:hypothetical protein
MVSTIAKGAFLVAVIAGCLSLQTPTPEGSIDKMASEYQHYLALTHLLAFASWFGCSMWVTFISGIIMFKNLPRHTFGRLQSRLFPAYFQFSAATLVLSIASSHLLQWNTTTSSNIIDLSLVGIFATVLLNMLFLEPATTSVMYQRHAVEKRLGTGHEVGKLKPDDPKKANDPELRALSKQFGKLHGASALSNLAALGLGCVWMNFLATKLDV